jgi:hypothetical protein
MHKGLYYVMYYCIYGKQKANISYLESTAYPADITIKIILKLFNIVKLDLERKK